MQSSPPCSPWFSEKHILLALGPLKVSAAQLLAIASILFLTVMNMGGLRTGRIVQDIFTLAKTAALVGLIVLGIVVGRNAEAVARNFSDLWSEGEMSPALLPCRLPLATEVLRKCYV